MRLTRRIIVKIPFAHMRMSAAALMLVIALPILAACGGSPETVAPTPGLPTAAVGTTAPANATAAPATSAPNATSEVVPPGPAAEPTTAPAGSSSPKQNLEFGIVNHLYYTDRERVLTLDTIAGFDWVRQQVVWKDVEGPQGNYAWGDLDKIVDDVAAHKLKLLVNIVQAPSFYTPDGQNGLPQDPTVLGNFVAAMATHYGTKISAYEIWNEQNLAHENGGRVTVEDAGHYVDILVECYNQIKAANPAAVVLAGAPSSSGVNNPSLAVSDENYYRAMYKYKDGIIKTHFDAQAVHPGGSANPPDTMWPDNPSAAQGWTNDGTFYFRHVEDVRKFMEEEGVGDHQIWITEFGWATRNTSRGFEFGNQTSFEQQADYIVGAMRRTKEQYPWVGAMFLWNLNFAILRARSGQPLHEQASFRILNANGSPRPAFLAIQEYLAAQR